jgi:putative oxidoreductase
MAEFQSAASTSIDHSGSRARLAGLTLLALRVISALVLFEHSTVRAFGFPVNPDRPFRGAPDPFTRPWFSTVLELVGGTLLILGLFTRPTAFVLSGMMAVAYFIAHAPEHFFPIINGGEPAVLLCFVFLYMSAAGAGPYSVDAMLETRRSRRQAGDPRS